ncbi:MULTISPECIES: hypothetical protein [Moorena]|uniref:WD-40 repeat-containing protein n=1 Tax=Moorena producens 3L TaxID=489825 RepID=F4XUV9_9CYAN|nr:MULTISPECIES: hypothetical protein [Moorena]EGJ31662.1 WD-40 repeat-containing protein [Moorena producens 3L]NEP70016.1 hypothetical protein [Moorena sp. SIO3A5]NER91325.1 hypothetical protein [Moorena sp. SIO3A2]OLT66040.1 hypothetical protein BI334_14345 [Moorena producens 3L]
MKQQNPPETLAPYSARSLLSLSRAIMFSQGEFALILVRCNYELFRKQIWQYVREITELTIGELILNKSSQTLFSNIFTTQQYGTTSALMVSGLESVDGINQVLLSANQVRDELPKCLTCPLVVWVTDKGLQKLIRLAPYFKNWATTSIRFELTIDQLLALCYKTTDEIFASILAKDLGEFLPNKVLSLASDCPRRQEFEWALQDLQSHDISVDSVLLASKHFILGRDAFENDQINLALEHYQQSLNFWQQDIGEWAGWLCSEAPHSHEQYYKPVKQVKGFTTIQARASRKRKEGKRDTGNCFDQRLGQTKHSIPPFSHPPLTPSGLERLGLVFYHIGLCYCRQAQLQGSIGCHQWEQAQKSFCTAIEVFTTTGRLDLVAQLTIKLGEVLQHLENWTELEALALAFLAQPQTQDKPVQLSRAYGFLATVAYEQSHWNRAIDLALTAVGTLETYQPTLNAQKLCHRGSYLLLAARSVRQLGKPKSAINYLEQAINLKTIEPNPLQQQPQLFMELLEELRTLYFEQKAYQRGFELKQQKRLIEQQFRFSTFAGMAPLQSVGPSREIDATITKKGFCPSALEIAAAGRQTDVNSLLERISRNDHKLTVIHGTSGVGKSSLINAGLLPALSSRIIGARQTLTVVQTVYRNWLGELEKRLDLELASTVLFKFKDANLSPSTVQPTPRERLGRTTYPKGTLTAKAILDKLYRCSQHNLLTVLIFDQFEEFFFLATDLGQRHQFYDFLAQALNLPFVKIILSMREDYLHYLLEFERYKDLSVINNNILDQKLRYHLGDLSPENAKNVIHSLTAVSQLKLEPALIEALLKDLVTNTGVVRLIELQVVGAQLQAEKITTLPGYRALGDDPKTVLVERSLSQIIYDCGPENEDAVWEVLFSLTDQRGTRPLKTQAELAVSNGNNATLTQIPLILEILVGSGLVFRVPETPQNRYQLIHDYLVLPIRQKYKQRTQSNIKVRLKQSESQLLRVRKQRLRAIAISTVMAVLAVTNGGLRWRAEAQRINAMLSALSASSEALFVSNKTFDALLEGLRAAKKLQQEEQQYLPSRTVEADTRLQVITALSQAVYSVSEHNRLEGHSDIVSSISFSPDGQFIASTSRDKTVKLWHPDGKLIQTIEGHQDSVTSVSFSADSQLIASSSWDGTVRLWRQTGELVRTITTDAGHIYSVSFSQDGQMIAAAGKDKKIRLWTVDGQLIKTFSGHRGVVRSVSFSRDGKIIASASADNTIKLWSQSGTLLNTLRGHSAQVNCVVFSPDSQLIASASDDQTVRLWSTNGKLIKTFPKHQRWVLGVAFSADGQLIASASDDNTVRLWNREGTLINTFKGHSDGVSAVSFSPTEPFSSQDNLAHSNSHIPLQPSNPQTDQLILASASHDKTIKLWSSINQSHVILRGHQDDVQDVTFSPDSQQIATASNDRTVKLWDRNGKLLQTLTGHHDLVYSISLSADGELIASGSRDGTVKLWHRSGTLIKTIKAHQDWVLNVSFSPDSKRLASASRDRTVKIWDRTGKLIHTLSGHSERVNAVKFSQDSKRLASASDDKTVKLWSADGKLLKTLPGHRNWVLDVSFSPDNKFLATASYDNTLKLWRKDGTLQSTLKGHTDSVAKVRFSPKGKILATSSWDNQVQLWRFDDTLIKTLKAGEHRVTNLSWSHDGTALAVASEDGTVAIWNLNLDDLLDKSCHWLRNYLQNNPEVRESDRQLCQLMTNSYIKSNN